MPGADANGNGAPAVPFTLPTEEVQVGWTRLPDGTYRASVTFIDVWGTRTHLLDGACSKTVGDELVRLSRFLIAGLEPPPVDQVIR